MSALGGAPARRPMATHDYGDQRHHSMNEFLYPSIGASIHKDFAPIILIGMLPMIAANPSLPAEFRGRAGRDAKARPDKIDVAPPSTTAMHGLRALEDTQRRAVVRHSKGSATALTGGHGRTGEHSSIPWRGCAYRSAVGSQLPGNHSAS